MPIIRLQGREEKAQGIYYEFDYTLEPLGVGGMGKVYKGRRVNQATHAYTDVAIKFMFDDLPEHVIERARREASIQIHNENLVEMLGFIQIDEITPSGDIHQRYHVVSELLEGVMLDDLLKGKVTDRQGNVIPFAQKLYREYMDEPYRFATFVIKNILSGIMALHDKGYIHRDIDPTNIMVTYDGKIKLIDFGIAKQLTSLNTQDKALTSAGQFMGKALYASPELVLGDVNHQDKTTDIYSIGIMLFQFIVGHPPFEGSTHEVLEMQLHSKLPLDLIKQKRLREVIAKATAKKQSERYQTAAEFRVAVEQLEGLPYPDNRVIDPELLKKVLISGAAVLAVALISIGSYFYIQHAKEEKAQLAYEESLRREAARQDSLRNLIPPYDKALTLLMDSSTAREGLQQLRQLVEDRSSDKAALLLGRLYYNGKEKSDSVVLMQQYLTDILKQDNQKAHELNRLAFELDSMSYKNLYELGCDFYAGKPRTDMDETRDVNKAIEYFRKGLQLAKEKGDNEYEEKFSKRLKALGE